MTIPAAIIRLVTIYMLRILIHAMHVFPVKKGRIVFNGYRGQEYSCNPKYLSEFVENKNSGEFEIIWAFRRPQEYDFLTKRGIKVVKYSSLRRMFYEATAQFSINNVGSFSWLPLRKGQIHINTWHGGGCYKKVSLGEKKNNYFFKKSLIMTARETSYFISSSRFFSDVIIPNDFGYHGKLLEVGMPRNDILINEKNTGTYRKSICRQYQIPEENRIILYAPTWRYDRMEEIVLPDVGRVKKAAEKRFQGPCTVLFRAHANLKAVLTGEFVDVSEYADMQILLLISDMLLTDYSSCMWDFSLMLKPCILFVPDLLKYKKERGFVVDIEEWGFPICKNDRELEEVIIMLDEAEYKEKIRAHHTSLGSYEKGNASEAVYKLICKERKS